MKQQTAVEWFSEQVINKFNEFHIDHILIIDFRLNMIKLENQAKAMEKDQMIKFARSIPVEKGVTQGGESYAIFDAEKHYNETYNK